MNSSSTLSGAANSAFTAVEPRATPRVGIVYRLTHPGGVQSVVLSLIKGLNQRGIIPELIWDQPPDQDMLDEKGVHAGFHPVALQAPSIMLDMAPITVKYILVAGNVFTSKSVGKAYDFYYIFFNGFLVNDGTPHLYFLNGPPLLPQLDAVSPGLRGVPYRILRWLYKVSIRKRYPAYEYHRDSDYVINSQYTAELFEEAHGVRLPIVTPPIDVSNRSYRSDDLPERDTITYFSRFIDYKRPDMVVDLARRFPHMRVVLMGGVKPNVQEYYDGLVKSAEGLQNVTFLANPSNEKVNEELARARFYIFPGINEHFGMTTAEAIASGAIPFVHNSGGQREIVPDERLRFTDDEYASKFQALLDLPESELNQLRSHLSEHIRQYSEEIFIEKMLAYLDKAVPSGSQQAILLPASNR